MSDLPPDVAPSPPDAYTDEHNYDAWIGRNVYESGDSEPVGVIDEIFYDAGTQRPEWIVLADSRLLVPIAGTTIGGTYGDLYLGFDRATIAGAPTAPPPGTALTVAEEQALYAYYGFTWDDPVPTPLPPRFDDGWDTNWTHPQPIEGG